MFLRDIDDLGKIWVFTLIGNGRIVGQVVGYILGANATPITIEVRAGATNSKTTEIPWTSIMYIEEL